jgi:hypothetical protein
MHHTSKIRIRKKPLIGVNVHHFFSFFALLPGMRTEKQGLEKKKIEKKKNLRLKEGVNFKKKGKKGNTTKRLCRSGEYITEPQYKKVEISFPYS